MRIRINTKGPEHNVPALRLSKNPWGSMKGPQPLHQQSAGGGVYVAEERLKAASYINFWP